MNGRDLVEAIKAYGERAKGKEISCGLATCPRCAGQPARFKQRGVRERLFLVFAEAVVRRVWSYLTRWTCPLCKCTFTFYPDFALPFKRYLLPFMRARCGAYVEDDVRTYLEGVQEQGRPISHEDADGGVELWPSTLWRWVTALGGFPETVRQALNLIKQKDPSTKVFRALGDLRIRAGKFRSKTRRLVLQRCRELEIAEQVYARLFSVCVFPDLAMRCGWR
jgi:hypothetical protein